MREYPPQEVLPPIMIKILDFGLRMPRFECEFLLFHLCVCVTLNILLNFSEPQFLICKTRIILIVVIIIGNIYLVLVMSWQYSKCFICIGSLNPIREVI